MSFFLFLGDKDETAAIKAISLLSLLLFFNITSIIDLSSIIFGWRFIKLWDGTTSGNILILTIIIALFIINYYFFMGKDEFLKIKKDFIIISRKKRVLKIVSASLFIGLSILLVAYTTNIVRNSISVSNI